MAAILILIVEWWVVGGIGVGVRVHKALFGLFFFITQFPSLITHHFKYYTRLAPSLNIFHTICEPHTCHSLQAFFFQFFFQYPNSPNLVEKKKKKKKKKKPRTGWSERKKKKKKKKKKKERRNLEQTEVKERSRRKKKKKNWTANQEKKGKKKVKSGKKLRSVLFVGPLSVFNYNIGIELWVMSYGNWKQPKCVFSFHNS